MREPRFKPGDEAVTDKHALRFRVVAIDGSDYVIHADGRYQPYDIARFDNLYRPAPRSIEDIVQEAVEDYFGQQAWFNPRPADSPLPEPWGNALAAIIEAAILADREERA
jgi:hypothetical protein